MCPAPKLHKLLASAGRACVRKPCECPSRPKPLHARPPTASSTRAHDGWTHLEQTAQLRDGRHAHLRPGAQRASRCSGRSMHRLGRTLHALRRVSTAQSTFYDARGAKGGAAFGSMTARSVAEPRQHRFGLEQRCVHNASLQRLRVKCGTFMAQASRDAMTPPPRRCVLARANVCVRARMRWHARVDAWVCG